MANKQRGSIVVSFLNDLDTESPEVTNQLREHIATVIAGEEGKRLLRALNRATGGHEFTIAQTPPPKAPEHLTRTLTSAERAKREAETAAYFEARKQMRAQSAEYTAALRRLTDKGLDGPSQQQVLEEMTRARTEAAAAVHASNRTTRATTITDAAVKRIIKQKQADG